MPMPTDEHEKALFAHLRLASDAARVGFAAVCAERLVATIPPGPFDTIRRNLRGALDVAWDRAKGLGVSAKEIERQLRIVMQHVVADDSLDGSADSATVQEAVAAALFALRQATDEGPQNAIYAARQLTDATDRRVQGSFGPRLLAAEYEPLPQERVAMRAARDRLQQDLVRVVAAVRSAEALDALRRSVCTDSLLVDGTGEARRS